MARTSWSLYSPSSAQQGASHAASCRRLSCIATVCQGEAVSCSAFFRSQWEHAQPVLFPARGCCGRLCLWLCHGPIALCSYADEIIRTNVCSEKCSACRTAFLVAVAGLTAGVCLVSAASSLALLWVAAPLAGFAFGCHWSLMPPLASELFGMRSFASLYCLLQFATTFGTYAFATRLVRPRGGTCCLLPLRRLCSP